MDLTTLKGLELNEGNISTNRTFQYFQISDTMQGSQNVPATGYFWLSAVYKFVKNKNRSW
jgi:hypothetical protein